MYMWKAREKAAPERGRGRGKEERVAIAGTREEDKEEERG